MSRRATVTLLWIVLAAFLPLPYLFFASGNVPVVRFVFLAAVTATYASVVDGSQTAWPMAGIMFAHAATFSAALYVVARIAVRFLPPRLRVSTVALAFLFAAGTALTLPIYTTPMDDTAAHCAWLELFS